MLSSLRSLSPAICLCLLSFTVNATEKESKKTPSSSPETNQTKDFERSKSAPTRQEEEEEKAISPREVLKTVGTFPYSSNVNKNSKKNNVPDLYELRSFAVDKKNNELPISDDVSNLPQTAKHRNGQNTVSSFGTDKDFAPMKMTNYESNRTQGTLIEITQSQYTSGQNTPTPLTIIKNPSDPGVNITENRLQLNNKTSAPNLLGSKHPINTINESRSNFNQILDDEEEEEDMTQKKGMSLASTDSMKKPNFSPISDSNEIMKSQKSIKSIQSRLTSGRDTKIVASFIQNILDEEKNEEEEKREVETETQQGPPQQAVLQQDAHRVAPQQGVDIQPHHVQQTRCDRLFCLCASVSFVAGGILFIIYRPTFFTNQFPV